MKFHAAVAHTASKESRIEWLFDRTREALADAVPGAPAAWLSACAQLFACAPVYYRKAYDCEDIKASFRLVGATQPDGSAGPCFETALRTTREPMSQEYLDLVKATRDQLAVIGLRTGDTADDDLDALNYPKVVDADGNPGPTKNQFRGPHSLFRQRAVLLGTKERMEEQQREETRLRDERIKVLVAAHDRVAAMRDTAGRVAGLVQDSGQRSSQSSSRT